MSNLTIGRVRSALVTGASRGIGLGIATELARQGYALTITSRKAEDLEAAATQLMEAGAHCVTVVPADLAQREQVAAVVTEHRRVHGSMDALVLNGGVGAAGPIEKLKERHLDLTLEVNVAASVLVLQQSMDLLLTAAVDNPGGARVIILSSITGVHAEPGLAVYGAAKAALISLAETVNAERSADGVLATAIAPGYVATDMSAWVTDSIPADKMITVQDVVEVARMVLGLGRNTAIGKVVMSRAGSGGNRA